MQNTILELSVMSFDVTTPNLDVLQKLQDGQDELQAQLYVTTSSLKNVFQKVEDGLDELRAQRTRDIMLATLTGMLVVRVMGLANHIKMRDVTNPMWVSSLAILSLQNVVNLFMWLFVTKEIRKQSREGTGQKFIKTIGDIHRWLPKISLFLTFLSIVHNGLSIANDLQAPLDESGIFILIMSILSTLINILFVAFAAYKMLYTDDDTKPLWLSNIAEAISALNVPAVAA